MRFSLLASGLTVLAFTPCADAQTFHFEADEGYSTVGGRLGTGTLVFQTAGEGSPQSWFTYSGDSRQAFIVTAGAGYGGGQGVVSRPQIGNALYNDSPGRLLDGAATEFRFGLKFRFLDAPFDNGEAFDGFFGLRIDDTNGNGSNFEIYLNAGMGYVVATTRDAFGNATRVWLTDSSGQRFRARQGEWYEITGFGSYATDTYSVFVDSPGVASAAFRATDLGFRYHGLAASITPGARAQADDILRLWQAKTDPALYRQIALDDVYYAAVPEPASVVATLGLLAFFFAGSRRNAGRGHA